MIAIYFVTNRQFIQLEYENTLPQAANLWNLFNKDTRTAVMITFCGRDNGHDNTFLCRNNGHDNGNDCYFCTNFIVESELPNTG